MKSSLNVLIIQEILHMLYKDYIQNYRWILKKKYDKRTVKCGDLNCKFEFKTFDYEKKHLETVI